MYKEISFKDRKDWLSLRQKGVGGSDVSSIIGVNKYKTNVELWEEKISDEKPKEINNPAIKRGNDAENPILELFKAFNPHLKIDKPINMFMDSKKEWRIANLDGLGEDENGKFIFEIKTAELNNWSTWENGIPANYLCQLLWYMSIMGIYRAKLVLGYKYRGHTDIMLREFNIPNESYPIEQMLEEIKYIENKVEEFQKCVINRLRPNLIKIF